MLGCHPDYFLVFCKKGQSFPSSNVSSPYCSLSCDGALWRNAHIYSCGFEVFLVFSPYDGPDSVLEVWKMGKRRYWKKVLSTPSTSFILVWPVGIGCVEKEDIMNNVHIKGSSCKLTSTKLIITKITRYLNLVFIVTLNYFPTTSGTTLMWKKISQN